MTFWFSNTVSNITTTCRTQFLFLTWLRRILASGSERSFFSFHAAFRLPFARVLRPAGLESDQPGVAGGGEARCCTAASLGNGRLRSVIE